MKDSIKFLTYNTYQKPMGLNVVKNEFKSERNNLFGDKIIENFDILAL